MARRRCPQCAERVRQEALVCRFCGTQLPAAAEEQQRAIPIALITGGTVALVGAILVYSAFHDLSAQLQPREKPPPRASPAPQVAGPQYPKLGIGETVEWTAKNNALPVFRQAGPYVLEITRHDEDEMAAPVVRLSADGQTVTFEGEMASPGFSNKISLVANRARAVPVVMLQSFSGGAHCCNHVQLAGFSGGKLKVVDLGSWDGDEIDPPKDITGDGSADFVMRDDRFLYAFASYAESFAPPRIFNVVAGKMIEVSRNSKFNALYLQEMRRAGEQCHPGNGSSANGACPSFVAAAARVGKLDQAWAQMLGAYDATVDWSLPTGCWVSDEKGCPSGQEITYKSYPDALRAFLANAGYIPMNWVPPERRRNQDEIPPETPDDDRTA